MKNLVAFGLTILLTISTGFLSLAQVRVTGHVFAEIVETASINSNTNNSIQVQQNQSPGSIELGEVTINGGMNTACSIMINSSELKGENGNHAAFTAIQSGSSLPQVLNANGSQVIKLNGMTGSEILAQNDKMYSGQYQVIFAYN